MPIRILKTHRREGAYGSRLSTGYRHVANREFFVGLWITEAATVKAMKLAGLEQPSVRREIRE